MQTEFFILYWLQDLHNAVLDPVMTGLSTVANKGMIWILLAFAFLFFVGTRKSGCSMLLALLLSYLLCNLLLKNIIQRDRPCWLDTTVPLLVGIPKDYSFPSGHSSASFSAAVALFLHHKKAGAAALVLAGLIAFSRLYLFVHFPTDVLAGILTGIFCAVVSVWMVDLFQKRMSRGGSLWKR